MSRTLLNRDQFNAERSRLLKLLEAFYTPEEAKRWLATRHPALGMQPSVLILRGRGDEVEAEIERLETGAYV